MKKIGFFSGTFDPVHFGHLNLAIQMKEHFKLDSVLLSCTPCSPFKLENPPQVSFEHRMKMLSSAIDEIEFFSLCDIEAKFNKISYTIDALKELKKIYIDSTIFLIISNEMAKDFDKWKSCDEILELSSVLVGTREKNLQFDFLSNKISKENFIDIPIFEISSTQIRQRLKKNLYCGHLLPHKVLEYIDKHDLYRS